MRYTMSINAVKCQEWGLNLNQGALFDLLNQVSGWANTVIVDGEVYYWASRKMIIEEIPLAYGKTDTVYRAFKDLANKGLIEYIKYGQKDLVRLTEKGKEWNNKNSEINPNNGKNDDKNSEINPTFSQKLGNKSEKMPKNSEINPTDKNTSNPNTNYQGTRTHSQKIEPVKNPQKSKTQKSNSMTKPTIEQVTEYFAERKHPSPATEAEHWLDYYTANGWKVGKNPMQDWKATIRNWMRHDTGDQNHAAHQHTSHQAHQSSADRYEQMLAQQLAEDRQRSVRDVF